MYGIDLTEADAPSRPRVATWLRVAAVMLGVAWGANQFPPLLGLYRDRLDLGAGTLEALFGAYALGLVPGLLIAAPLSDSRGRRSVVVPAAVLSLVASCVLAAGAASVALLYVGRLIAGISSGIVFGAGTAWLREASAAEGEAASARRAAVAMTTGFALGPLVAGFLAQWLSDPLVVAYLPHIALMIAVLVVLAGAPETVSVGRRRFRLAVQGFGISRFRRVVVPMAPWVFATPAVAFALLPDVVDAAGVDDGTALVALVTSLTAAAGVAIQPVARRLGSAERLNRAAVAGLVVAAGGMAAAALTAATGDVWMLLPDAVVLGSAYGLCVVAGLSEVGRLAPEGQKGSVTAGFYAVTYLGFGVPYLLALAHGFLGYPVLLAIVAVLALFTAAVVSRPSCGGERG